MRAYKYIFTVLLGTWSLVAFSLERTILLGPKTIGKALLSGNAVIFKVGASSFLVSNVINNIPMTVLYGSVTGAGGGSTYLPAVYAAIIGSNLGAVLTPVGALAGITFSSILKVFQVNYSFKRYAAYGAAVGIPALISALLGLALSI